MSVSEFKISGSEQQMLIRESVAPKEESVLGEGDSSVP